MLLLPLMAAGGNFVPPFDPYFSSTTLLLKATGANGAQNNTFLDSSSNAFTITRNGGAPGMSQGAFSPFSPAFPYSPTTHGGSGYFDGVGDFLTTGTGAGLNLNGVDWTLSGWFYPTASSAGIHAIVQSTTGTNNWEPYLSFTLAADNSVRTTINAVGYATTSAVATLNAWNYFEMARSGSTVTTYLNGASVHSVTSDLPSSNLAFEIGKTDNYQGYLYYFPGYISGIRVLNGTAGSGAIPTTPPTAITNTQLLLNFTNAGIIDAHASNVVDAVGNAQCSTGTKKWLESVSFDGTGDQLLLNSAIPAEFGTGDFTIECYLHLNSVTGVRALFDSRGAGNPATWNIVLYMNGAVISFYSNQADRIAGSTLSTGVWYHIALCRSGSSTKLFVAGVQVGSTYTDTNTYVAVAPLRIAADDTNQANCYIEDFRITKGVARYTTTFTPPEQLVAQ